MSCEEVMVVNVQYTESHCCRLVLDNTAASVPLVERVVWAEEHRPHCHCNQREGSRSGDNSLHRISLRSSSPLINSWNCVTGLRKKSIHVTSECVRAGTGTL